MNTNKKTKLYIVVTILVIIALSVSIIGFNVYKKEKEAKVREEKTFYIEELYAYADRIALEIPFMTIDTEEAYKEAMLKHDEYDNLITEVKNFLTETETPEGCYELQSLTRSLIAEAESIGDYIKNYQENSHEINLALENDSFDTVESKIELVTKMKELEEQSSGFNDKFSNILDASNKVKAEYTNIKNTLDVENN